MPYKDRDKQREYQREWVKRKKRSSPDVGTKRFFNFRCSKLKERASKKQIPFDLTPQYLEEIWPRDGMCPALNIKMTKGPNGLNHKASPSIDKIIAEQGYVKGNVQWISHIANMIKSNATSDQIIQVGLYLKGMEKIKHGKEITEYIRSITQ